MARALRLVAACRVRRATLSVRTLGVKSPERARALFAHSLADSTCGSDDGVARRRAAAAFAGAFATTVRQPSRAFLPRACAATNATATASLSSAAAMATAAAAARVGKLGAHALADGNVARASTRSPVDCRQCRESQRVLTIRRRTDTSSQLTGERASTQNTSCHMLEDVKMRAHSPPSARQAQSSRIWHPRASAASPSVGHQQPDDDDDDDGGGSSCAHRRLLVDNCRSRRRRTSQLQAGRASRRAARRVEPSSSRATVVVAAANCSTSS